MATDLWFPLQRVTDDAMNDGDLIGRTVFLANQTSGQTIATATETALTWDGIDLDLMDGWSAGSPTRWTCPKSGWYMFTGGAGLSASTGGTYRETLWRVDGSAISMGRARVLASTAIANEILTVDARSLPRQLTASQYVELAVNQNSGGNLTTQTGAYRSFISITFVGPPTT